MTMGALLLHMAVHESNGDYDHLENDNHYSKPQNGEEIRTAAEALRSSLFGDYLDMASSNDGEAALRDLEDKILSGIVTLSPGSLNAAPS